MGFIGILNYDLCLCLLSGILAYCLIDVINSSFYILMKMNLRFVFDNCFSLFFIFADFLLDVSF